MQIDRSGVLSQQRVRRVALALLALGTVASVVIASTRGEGTSRATSPATTSVANSDAPPVAIDPFVDLPQADSELAPAGQPPADAGQFCSPAPASQAAECRITESLADPPRPGKPSGNGLEAPRKSSVNATEPISLGRAAVADAADPFVLVDGLTYFLFSTSADWLRAPVSVIAATDLIGTAGAFSVASAQPGGVPKVTRTDAMPDRPAWALDEGIWAPTVAKVGGRYVMYFASKRPNPPEPVNGECIGRAFSEHAGGPYLPDPEPFTCGLGGIHGALDPSFFRSSDGTPYLLIASGGTSTPLWSIRLTATGDAAAAPLPLLRMQQPWETWFLENPDMLFNGRTYVLTYSAGDWRTPGYSTGVATCNSPSGPCTSSPAGPWLSTNGDVSGPGGLSFFVDVFGNHMAAHHGYSTGSEALFGARSTFLRRVKVTRSSIAFE